MVQRSLDFLHRLLDTPGPSGFESRAASVWRDEASAFAAVTTDVAGNSHATVQGAGGPSIMIAGHIDEIGVIVNYIDDDGFIFLAPIGGWNPQVLVGQRLRFLGRDGDVFGVIGDKPIHLIKPEDKEKAVKFTDIWADIGATSRSDAEARIAIGDPGVIDARIVEMPNGRLVSRAIDDRIGAFIALEALRDYAARPGAATLTAVATTQEEIGYHGGGALIAASRLNPAMAIAVDVTPASDHPSVEKKETGDRRLGAGPVLARGSVISPAVFRLLRETAERLQIPYSVQAAGRDTNTDADFITIAREGIATALLSVPDRYLHTPNEMVSLEDLERTITLLAETCRVVTSATDFTAR
jgi:putative aminopeptidase FrvX